MIALPRSAPRRPRPQTPNLLELDPPTSHLKNLRRRRVSRSAPLKHQAMLRPVRPLPRPRLSQCKLQQPRLRKSSLLAPVVSALVSPEGLYLTCVDVRCGLEEPSTHSPESHSRHWTGRRYPADIGRGIRCDWDQEQMVIMVWLNIGPTLMVLRLYVFFSAAYLTSLAVTVRIFFKQGFARS